MARGETGGLCPRPLYDDERLDTRACGALGVRARGADAEVVTEHSNVCTVCLRCVRDAGSRTSSQHAPERQRHRALFD